MSRTVGTAGRFLLFRNSFCVCPADGRGPFFSYYRLVIQIHLDHTHAPASVRRQCHRTTCIRHRPRLCPFRRSSGSQVRCVRAGLVVLGNLPFSVRVKWAVVSRPCD